MIKFRTVFLLLISFAFLSSCNKNKYKNYCKSESAIKGITEDSVNVFIPLGFTPDGDGLNDTYYFACKGIREYTVTIKSTFSTLFSVSNVDYWRWNGENDKGKIKDGEYDVEATLITNAGNTVTVNTTVSVMTDYDEIYPCRCTMGDQIDSEFGFISGPNKVCDNSEQ
jgi:hypothetical protein